MCFQLGLRPKLHRFFAAARPHWRAQECGFSRPRQGQKGTPGCLCRARSWIEPLAIDQLSVAELASAVGLPINVDRACARGLPEHTAVRTRSDARKRIPARRARGTTLGDVAVPPRALSQCVLRPRWLSSVVGGMSVARVKLPVQRAGPVKGCGGSMAAPG
jgi:hypothetical protein